MSLTVSPICINPISPAFSQSKIKLDKREKADQSRNENPISRTGEVFDMIKTTFVGGLGLSIALLLNWCELDSEPEKTASAIYENVTKKIKDKNILIKIGASVSAVAAGVCGMALLYTIFKAPKIAYESKVKTYKKEKEMDVYIKANNSEAMLYEQLADKAKHSTTKQEQAELKNQFAQLSIAKNQLPDFIQKDMQVKEAKKNKK